MNGNQEILENWETIKERIKTEFDLMQPSFDSFIKPLQIKSFNNDSIQIIIPFDQNQAIGIDYYNRKYRIMFQTVLGDITGKHLEVEFIYKENNIQDNPEPDTEAVNKKYNSELKSEYTFDTFVVGDSNQIAYSAAVAVSENPGIEFNPLFIYGGPGVGKTHLMHAIGHAILAKNKNANVLYVTTETFTNDLVKSIRAGGAAKEQFREKYRTVDALLLDDIQFIEGKDGTQEEIFHTFNELHDANKAIIISSDKAPKDIKNLEERLKSRFDMGLTADINPPNYPTRVAILQQYFERNHMKPNDEIIDYIASNVKSNIRELAGAFNKLKLISISYGNGLTLDLVKQKMSDYINENNDHKLSLEEILDVVCSYYNVTIDDINSNKRSRDIAHPRQVATYLCRTLTDYSQEKVGEVVGNRDHSTVINSVKKINEEMTNDINTKNEIEEIRRMLGKN